MSETRRKTIRFPKDMMDAIEGLSKEMDVSSNYLLRNIVEQTLQGWNETDKELYS